VYHSSLGLRGIKKKEEEEALDDGFEGSKSYSYEPRQLDVHMM